MDIGTVRSFQATSPAIQQSSSLQEGKEQPPAMPEDSFSKEDRGTGGVTKKTGAWKSTVVKAAVGAAVGAGVLALAGGSVMAAIGISTGICAGLGALKGLTHAILGNFSFNGNSGSSSALDRNPVTLSLIMGTIGAAKGAVEGVVLGGLSGFGFGPLGGAVAGAIMPSLEKVGGHMFEKLQHNHQGPTR